MNAPSASLDGPPALRVAVIGAGLIAQAAHVPMLSALDAQFEIVHLVDPSRRRRDALARRFGIPRTSAHHHEALDSPPDAVLVCAPNGLHAEIVLDALAAGAHVFVEKPLCLTTADADAIVARAEIFRRVVQVGYMKRHDPVARRLLDTDPVPDVRLAFSHTVDPDIGRHLAPSGLLTADDVPAALVADVRAKTETQVAAALDAEGAPHARVFSDAFLGALVHDVNLMRGLLGEPVVDVVDATGHADGSSATVSFALDNGARWSASWQLLPGAGPFTERLGIHTSDRIVELDFDAPYVRGRAVSAREERRSGETWTSASSSAYADPYRLQLEHFHACVTQGVTCLTPATQARDDIALLTVAYRHAMATGGIR